eukprot:TRINITY_DN26171_c0_g1_i1.p1 TRINITY_DN26171_c0_g1~~TRINITY_DN26171_c0_g1_i1.p1  ORF type:complete len:498 (+),score=94.96 TRINITY_DN26171_c0_g1_i1:42-1535(+)
MPPKAAPPLDFAISELVAGRKQWKAGATGPTVRLNEDSACRDLGFTVPQALPRHETTLLGKIMFGRNRFAFEIQQIDNHPTSVAALMKKRGLSRMIPPTSSPGVNLARNYAPMHSLQVRFEDIEKIEMTGLAGSAGQGIVVLKLKKPICCYQKPAGAEPTPNLKVVDDITGNARTLQFKVCSPPPIDDRMHKNDRQVVSFDTALQQAASHSPRLQALFQGNSPPIEEPPVTPQKKRRSDAPASVAKRIKKEAHGRSKLSAEDAAAVDADSAKEQLNEYVKDLAETVDADWHDSYEETGEKLQEWFDDCGSWVEEVVRVGTKMGAGFGQCHEVLKQVADTWSNIQAIPFRSCTQDVLDAGEGVTLGNTTVNSVSDLLGMTWPLLLARAAADEDVPNGILMQMIKDAYDHGVKDPHLPSAVGDEAKLFKDSRASFKLLQQGRRKLAQLVECRSEWEALPSTKKRHRMRRCIDRRFDGPKHLRTRDFGTDSEDDGGCSVM